MAFNTDWLPAREQDFVDLCQKWKIGLADAATVAAFGWKQAEVAEALAAVTAFLTARVAYEIVDSSANTMAKNEAKDVAKNVMRDFANSAIRYNRQMKDEDRLVYGIRPVDRTMTPSGVPDSYPEAEPDTSVVRQVTIDFWDSTSKRRRKPHGVHGAETRWGILDHVPTSVDELTHTSFNTASPLTLRFDEKERGLRLYFCLRWESNTGLKGPFGEIGSTIIP